MFSFKILKNIYYCLIQTAVFESSVVYHSCYHSKTGLIFAIVPRKSCVNGQVSPEEL